MYKRQVEVAPNLEQAAPALTAASAGEFIKLNKRAEITAKSIGALLFEIIEKFWH